LDVDWRCDPSTRAASAGIVLTELIGDPVDIWPFEAKRNTASITTRQVLEGAPILLVTHDADDGGWQFLCGTSDDTEDGRIVGMGQMYDRSLPG
jgi:hypothetical protein